MTLIANFVQCQVIEVIPKIRNAKSLIEPQKKLTTSCNLDDGLEKLTKQIWIIYLFESNPVRWRTPMT